MGGYQQLVRGEPFVPGRQRQGRAPGTVCSRIEHRHPSAPSLWQQALRNDVAERLRETRADLRLLIFREHAHDAIDGLGRVDRMQRGQHQMAGLGGFHRDLDRLDVAHLADEDDLRRLPERRPQRERESLGVRADFALVDRGLDVPVHVLDRIFDRDDVVGEILIQLIDDRRQRRRLTRTSGAGDEDDAVLQLANIEQLLRKLETFERRNAVRNHAQNDGVCAPLREDVDAETLLLRDRVRQIDRAVREQSARQLAVVAQHVHRDHLGLIRSETRQSGKVDRGQLAVDFHLWRPANRKVEIRDAIGDFQHRLEDGVEIEVLHGPCLGPQIVQRP